MTPIYGLKNGQIKSLLRTRNEVELVPLACEDGPSPTAEVCPSQVEGHKHQTHSL